jgi:MFS transporter, DHA2 family, multidrug resistance protein
MSLVMNLLMAAAPPERAGSAASLAETGAELGIAVGVATLGSLVTAIYRGALPGLLPADVTPVAAHTASEGISSASTIADPGVLDAARLAFTEGFNVVGIVGAIAFLVAAVMVRRVLGRATVAPSHVEVPVAA